MLNVRLTLRSAVAAALVPLVALGGCARSLDRRLVEPDAYATLDQRSPYLKVHARDGHTLILSEWSIDETERLVRGTGQLVDTDRRVVEEGTFEIPIDSVALFETNVARSHPSVVAMTIVTGISAAVTIVCATNPKACFGSCPTFYVNQPDGTLRLVAEGFSSSVAPSLEHADIDALYGVRARSSQFEIEMRNEALETHVVRHADLLAVARPPGREVFATSEGVLWQAGRVWHPTSCSAAEGDILPAVREVDGRERFSRTDSTDLAAREIIELEFADVPAGHYGLAIASRQSLVSTYLLYQTLAYMGRSAGEYIAQLERGDAWIRQRLRETGRTLGAIEVLVQDADGNWVEAGATAETGPLATDVRIVELPRMPARPILRVRLRLTRGYWRLDALQLARLDARVEPVRLQPVRVTRDAEEDAEALALLRDPQRALTTLPGDTYRLSYVLPKDVRDYTLFLESRGYYLEWMRQEWLAEEDPQRALEMFLDPQAALRRLAPDFKRVEAHMEAQFWGSTFSGDAFGGPSERSAGDVH